MPFKRICAIFVCLFLVALPAASNTVHAAQPEKAIAFVRNLTEKGINNILGADISHEEKTERFREMFLDAMDLEHISKYVLSRHWRKASPEQRKKFIKAFTDVTVLTWANRFDEYSGQDIDITGTHPSQNKSHIFVDSAVEMGKGPVEVIWRLHERADGSYRIIDIIIEKVSMAMTYRNEYASVIRSSDNGVEDLIKTINKKTGYLRKNPADKVVEPFSEQNN